MYSVTLDCWQCCQLSLTLCQLANGPFSLGIWNFQCKHFWIFNHLSFGSLSWKVWLVVEQIKLATIWAHGNASDALSPLDNLTNDFFVISKLSLTVLMISQQSFWNKIPSIPLLISKFDSFVIVNSCEQFFCKVRASQKLTKFIFQLQKSRVLGAILR